MVIRLEAIPAATLFSKSESDPAGAGGDPACAPCDVPPPAPSQAKRMEEEVDLAVRDDLRDHSIHHVKFHENDSSANVIQL